MVCQNSPAFQSNCSSSIVRCSFDLKLNLRPQNELVENHRSMKITLQLVLLQHFRTVHRQMERCEIICGNTFPPLRYYWHHHSSCELGPTFLTRKRHTRYYKYMMAYPAIQQQQKLLTNVLVISTIFHALFFVANDDKGNYVKKQPSPHPLNMYMNEKRQQWSNT